MKKFLILIAVAVFVISGYAQTQSVILTEYNPAPGQYINIDNIGTPDAARKVTSTFNDFVSLGSFGGYIIFKFENACINDSQHPYGIDFTIFGNAFTGSSEPGVVWVMKDENNNGLPDDTWYEIAGSNHFFSGTVKNYEVTYYNSGNRDVEWKNNQGEAGVITANEFNLQEYYPVQQHFPDYPKDSVTFSGTLMENHYQSSNSAEIKISPPAFGYADIRPKSLNPDLSIPDNPYTAEVEGAGGDPIDISWATDSQGNYVDLDEVHFVKIVSGSLNVLGWLGEISTEVSWIQPVKTNPGTTGKENLLVVKQLPPKILINDLIYPDAAYFIIGRKSDVPVLIQSGDENIIGINSEGWLEAKLPGEVQISFSAEKEEETILIKVAEPQSVFINNDFSAIYPGDTLELKAEIIDNWQEKLDLKPVFSVSGSTAGKIISDGESYYFVALQQGIITVTASVEEYQLQQQVQVNVNSPEDKIRIFVTIKSATENILPLQWIDAGLTDLNSSVEYRKNDYNSTGRMNVAHALAAGLNKAGVSYKFRDDAAAGGKLYLYKVEYDGLFSYGWGGKINPTANARAWIARLNDSQYINDFDSVLIADGDTLVLYHVPNIRDSWIYSRFLPVFIGESVSEFLLESAQCKLADDIITETGFSPVAGAMVQAEKAFTTGADGLVEVEHTALPLLVSSGNDAVLVNEELFTGNSRHSLIFNLFPNPVESTLFINFVGTGSQQGMKNTVKLYDINGRLLLEKLVSLENNNLNLSGFKQGMYYLVLSDGKRSEVRKILKQ